MATSQENLLTYCRWDFTKDAIAILNSNDDLDLTENDGVVFKHATKHSNPKLLGALLKYYETHKLQGDRQSQEYKAALAPFRKIIDDLEYCYDLKEKGVAEVLNPYLSENEEEEQDLANLDDVFVEEDYAPGSDYGNASESPHIPQTPEFCGWPDSLLHQRHLSGDSGNNIAEVH